MGHPVISIIIPVYNAKNYIEATLESILNQTYSNIEIICINDGSTDNSLSILNKYKEKIKIINQSNKGQCAASNRGLQEAKGDYIKFFDADDIMNPEHIELQIKKINGKKNAIASCEWGRFYNENPESAIFNPEPVWKNLKPIDWIKTALTQKSDMMGAWLWLIPRHIIEQTGGWDERLSLNNDFEFSIRLLLTAEQVLFTEGAKVYYRSGIETNLANTKCKKAYEAAFLSTKLGCQYILNKDNSADIKLLCANRYQEWAYRIFPSHSSLVKKIEQEIKLLGGSTKKIEGGKFFILLCSFLGWKLAKRIQISLYKFGYQAKNPHKTKQ